MSLGRYRNRCPHVNIRGVYGDEINFLNTRLVCSDCGRKLDGPALLATWSMPDLWRMGK